VTAWAALLRADLTLGLKRPADHEWEILKTAGAFLPPNSDNFSGDSVALEQPKREQTKIGDENER
jgi:hypothetical protein